MTEILYAGPVSLEKIPRMVAACDFEPDALFLAEHIPTHPIVKPEERRDLLRFTSVKEGAPCAEYSSGRIFQEDRELRWERQREILRVVYLGPADTDAEAVFAEYGMAKKQKEFDVLKKSTEPTYYALFGERLKSEDLPYFGKNAQPGDFAVLRIPRVLHYPVPKDGKPSARLQVCEYLNEVTGSVDLFRFQLVETWNDKKRGESA